MDLKKNRREFLSLTGLTVKEFKKLLPAFEQADKELHPDAKTVQGKRRKRQVGGGRRGVLDAVEQRLLFILVYHKTYPLQTLMGKLFEISQSQANYWIHRLMLVLKRALEMLGVMPERNPHAFGSSEAKRDAEPELIIDGTDRRRQRPKDKDKQAMHYSGKKKTHTDKNVVIVNRKAKRIAYLSQTYAGTAHDKKIADHEHITYPKHTKLYKDTGFQGYEPHVKQTLQLKKAAAQSTHASRTPQQSPTIQNPRRG
jgi:hypothetical protein